MAAPAAGREAHGPWRSGDAHVPSRPGRSHAAGLIAGGPGGVGRRSRAERLPSARRPRGARRAGRASAAGAGRTTPPVTGIRSGGRRRRSKASDPAGGAPGRGPGGRL